jgi:hypothetical protein
MMKRLGEIFIGFVAICFFLLAVGLLFGCTATGGMLTTKVPVPVECKEQEPERPYMATDALSKGAPVDQFVKAARAELLVRAGYEDRLVTALRGCIKPIAPTDYGLGDRMPKR